MTETVNTFNVLKTVFGTWQHEINTKNLIQTMP